MLVRKLIPDKRLLTVIIQYVSKQSYPFFKTKPEQNLNSFVLIMLSFCCVELENSVNSGTLLSESITLF